MRDLVVVRGAGDIASGTIAKLHAAGFPVIALECEYPSAIRRKVAFSEAVYNGEVTVEGITACLAEKSEIAEALGAGRIPVVVDPECTILRDWKPKILVDAILAKRNMGTTRNMAAITIGLGPGFTAGEDVDAVIETMRGHNLGRIYYSGHAIPNTGKPGKIGDYDTERVIYAPVEGKVRHPRRIGEQINKGEQIAQIGGIPVCAEISGVLRGILPEGFPVTKGYKMADIDPRLEEKENCNTISDKARCIAGGVLEAVLCLENR